MQYYYDMSRQEKIDRAMCKPGYTWNETLQKCLGYGGGTPKKGESGETANGAIKQETNQRALPKAEPPAPMPQSQGLPAK